MVRAREFFYLKAIGVPPDSGKLIEFVTKGGYDGPVGDEVERI